MSELKDLKWLGDELLPLFEEIFQRPKLDLSINGETKGEAIVKRLIKVTDEADRTTIGEPLARLEAILAALELLTEIIVQASNHPDSIPKTTLRIVEAQHIALVASCGRLLEVSALADIPSLLSPEEINTFNDDLTDRKSVV